MTARVPIIELIDVHHRYADVTALDGVSLRFGAGEFVAVCGPNGSGKSTLSKHLNGLLRPTSGQVLLEGSATDRMTVAEMSATVGFVFQNPDRQIFSYSVMDEVMFGLSLRGLSEAEVEQRATSALERVGLSDLGERHPRALSGGQRQRLATATVLAMEPPMLVLDEPTTGQDFHARRQLMELAREVHRAGSAVLVVTHDMALVAEYCDRAVVMQQGTVAFDGPPGVLFADDEVLGAGSLQRPAVLEIASRCGLLGEGPDLAIRTVSDLAAAIAAANAQTGELPLTS